MGVTLNGAAPESIFTGAIVGGKNAIINGGMDIWQRGTTTTSGGYQTADRWNNSVSGTTTISQETTDLPNGFQYGIKFVTAASSSFAQFKTYLERTSVIPLRNQVVTISGYLKITGGFSGNWVGQIYYSNTTDTATSVTTQVGSNVTIGTSATSAWTRFSFQSTIPSDAVGLGVLFVPDTLQASGVTVRTTGIQLELGSTATTFSRAGGSIGGELGLCQRYYYRSSSTGANPGEQTRLGEAIAYSTTQGLGFIKFPVTMRIIPTALDFASLVVYQGTTGQPSLTSVSINTDWQNQNMGAINFVSSGLTTTTSYFLGVTPSVSAYAGFSAEL